MSQLFNWKIIAKINFFVTYIQARDNNEKYFKK